MLRSFRQRQGITSVLAMLYLMLFAALAIGFYTSANTAVVVVDNEKKIYQAHTSAESGIDFIRFQLAQISVPAGMPQNQIFAYVADKLKTTLEGTPNFAGHTVGVTSSSVSIPANPDAYIRLDNSGAEFRAELTLTNGAIRTKVIGRHGAYSSRRAVQVDFERTDKPVTVFDYAIASRGKVVMSKGSITGVAGISDNKIATVMSAKSTSPAVSVSGGVIGGDLNVTAPGIATVTGGSVGGTTNLTEIKNKHIHVVDPPEFPTVDTSIFKQYAVNTYTSGSTLKNVRIPAGLNPKFTGGATIQGILYIESPNTIDFRGHVQLQGFIVFENKGNTMTNVLDMRGNFSHMPLPAGAEFDALRKIGGIAILAPKAKMVISGSVDSLLVGNVILGTFNNGGSADWTIDKGTLMTLDDSVDSAVFNGKTVKFKSVGSALIPTHG